MSQQPNNNSKIAIGKFGSAHGINGAIKVNAYTQPTSGMIDYTPWQIHDSDGWQLLEIENTRVQNNRLIVKLSSIDSREQAEEMVNKEIFIEAAQLPSLNPGEYYWKDLIGLSVYNHVGVHLGKVIELLETGANDVLVLKGEDKERLIPYLPDTVIIAVDLEKQTIRVNWDENF
jgi:16S rRNA processing protein RimM